MPHITPDNLKPGDVLMSLDEWELSQLIAAIEEGNYSHAIYWNGQEVIQGTLDGVTKMPLESLVDKCYVDAFRLRPRDGDALGSDGLPVAPVNAAVEVLIGLPYDYSNMVTLAWLIWSSRHHSLEQWARMLRVVAKVGWQRLLDELIQEMQAFTASVTATPAGRRQAKMTCTEVVTTSFWNADPKQGHRYGLSFLIPQSRAAFRAMAGPAEQLPPEQAERLEALLRESERLLLAVDPHIRERSGARFAMFNATGAAGQPLEVVAGSEDLPLGLVSPKEMETSPSLTKVGRLFP